MINRRNIRVKVMQTLYTIVASGNEVKSGDAEKTLQKQFDQKRQLFIYLIYFLSEVGRYAETDAHTRAGKHLPSFGDLHVNTKIAGNEILIRIREDVSFKQFVNKDKPELLLDHELIKRIYHEVAESKEYLSYISKQQR